MNFDDVIQQGKQKLRSLGLVEIASSDEETIHPRLPGLGWSGDGVSYLRNRAALQKYYIKTRLIGDHFTPDTTTTLFGMMLRTPILAAPMSGIKTNLREHIAELDFLKAILEGCAEAGTIGACGDGNDSTDGYLAAKAIKQTRGIAVLKPRSLDDIKARINALVEARNTVAIGVDVDGVNAMLLENARASKKSREDLQAIRSFWSGPMFLKGITNVEDAVVAHELGFDAIVVSNHGGRSIDYLPAPAFVLPGIVKALKHKIKILADGGIRNGFDAFIYFALGADAVLVGRTVLYGAIGGGKSGVATVIDKLTADLSRTMLVTDSKSIEAIQSHSIQEYA